MYKHTIALAIIAALAASAGSAQAHNQYKDEAPFAVAPSAPLTTTAPALKTVQSPTAQAGLLHDEGGYVGILAQPQAGAALPSRMVQSPVAERGLYLDEGMYVGTAVGG